MLEKDSGRQATEKGSEKQEPRTEVLTLVVDLPQGLLSA